MVVVWGGTHSGRLPHTLCRPWAIGSSLLATTPSSVVEGRRAAGQLAGARHHQRRPTGSAGRPDRLIRSCAPTTRCSRGPALLIV